MRENLKNPLVSVLMTVYNGGKYIEEALQSIADQTYPNKEVIIIDDGSTDNTSEIIRRFKWNIYYEYIEHTGIAAGWNRGVEKAKGVYITFLDSDDKWANNKLEKQVTYLYENPGVDIVFGKAMVFVSPELKRLESSQPKVKEQILPGISAGAMMIKREMFMEVGMFDSTWRKGIFCDWYLRATEMGLSVYTDPEIFLYRRIHNSNYGVVQKDKYVDYVRMLKASIDRKRNLDRE